MQKINIIYFDDYREESAGSKRFLLKMKKKNLYYVRNNKKSFFANTDFTCDVLLYKERDSFYVISQFHCTTVNSPNKRSQQKRLRCDEERLEYIKLLTKTLQGGVLSLCLI